MPKPHWVNALALLAFVLSGCASGPTVRVDTDPDADLSTYKTFGFFDQPGTGKSQYSTIITRHLKQATIRELGRLGYTHDEAAPQLRINFVLNVADKLEIRSTPGAFGGPFGFPAYSGFRDVETREYKAGTLAIDLVDVKTNALVWLGVAEGRLNEKTLSDPRATVDATVAEIFSNFPNAPAKRRS